MKITETDKGNIKIVMTRQQAFALYTLLDNLSFDNYLDVTGSSEDADSVCALWFELIDSKYML